MYTAVYKDRWPQIDVQETSLTLAWSACKLRLFLALPHALFEYHQCCQQTNSKDLQFAQGQERRRIRKYMRQFPLLLKKQGRYNSAPSSTLHMQYCITSLGAQTARR
jgi:hypothetical protein